MSKKKIYMIDLTHESSLGIGSDTMPLQLGLISAYCLKEHGDKVDIEIFKFTDEFEQAALDEPPFLIGVSNYLWNIDISKKYIQALKKRYPDVIAVCGGPNYPDEFDEQVQWLAEHPEMDFYIYKDGEVPFANLVGHLLENPDLDAAKKAKLPSCHALVNGEPFFGETAPRIRDLSTVPSPYVMGLMDKFFDKPLIPTIQTNRGCPFTCTFCTEGGRYYTKVYKSSLERKVAEVDYIIKHVKHTRTLRITDSNFGMFKQDEEFCEYLSEMQAKTGYPEYLMCSTGKNKKERVLRCNEMLNGAMRLTASVQSMSPEVLDAVKRNNISIDGLMYLSDETSETDTHAYSELILALPGDSVERHEDSMDKLMQIGIGNITQHQLALIHGTEMNSRESRERYGYQCRFRPIQRCIGRYAFGDDRFTAVEVEEIAVSTNTLSFEDYLSMRRLYLTVGMFYNDRIFGEIHALLRILGLRTFAWIKKIHDDIGNLDPDVRGLYEGFTHDTKAELWESPEQLFEDVSANVERYDSGELGGNIIYKYRSKSIVEHFEKIHRTAFSYLKSFLAEKGLDCDDIVADLERFSRYQKWDLLNTSLEYTDTFSYDIPKLITDAAFARRGGTLAELKYPTTVKIGHTDKQKATIKRELDFYGDDIPGLTMLISRYPIKRFWRRAEVI